MIPKSLALTVGEHRPSRGLFACGGNSSALLGLQSSSVAAGSLLGWRVAAREAGAVEKKEILSWKIALQIALGNCPDCFTEPSSPKDMSEEQVFIRGEATVGRERREVQSCIHQLQNKEAVFVPRVTLLTFLGLNHRPMMCRGPQKTAKPFSSMSPGIRKSLVFRIKGICEAHTAMCITSSFLAVGESLNRKAQVFRAADKTVVFTTSSSQWEVFVHISGRHVILLA